MSDNLSPKLFDENVGQKATREGYGKGLLRNMNNLPISIKIIGWAYTIMGLVIAGGFIFIGMQQLINPSTQGPSIFTLHQKAILTFISVIYGIGILLTAQGILRKNKIAWYSIFILILLFFPIPLSFLMIPIHLVVIWKLIEHRRLFGI